MDQNLLTRGPVASSCKPDNETLYSKKYKEFHGQVSNYLLFRRNYVPWNYKYTESDFRSYMRNKIIKHTMTIIEHSKYVNFVQGPFTITELKECQI